MKVVLPTADDGGLQATLAEHFGQARFFTVVDSETQEVSTRPNDGQHYGEGQTPAQIMIEAGAEVVLCGGLGRRAVGLFEQAGVQVMVGAIGTVQECLDAHRAGTLSAATQEGACPGGGHD